MTLCTVASMGFPRQEYWSGLPFSSPGVPPDPGIKFKSPAFQSEPPGKPFYTFRDLYIICIFILTVIGSWIHFSQFHEILSFYSSDNAVFHSQIKHIYTHTHIHTYIYICSVHIYISNVSVIKHKAMFVLFYVCFVLPKKIVSSWRLNTTCYS